MKHIALFLFLLTQISFLKQGFSQNITNEGTDFWLAFTETKNGAGNATFPAVYRICVTSQLGATGTVSIPGTGFSSNYTVAAGQYDTITLPPADATNLTSEILQNQAIYITASNPVAAYAYSQHLDRYEASLVLPTASLGSEYMISTYKNSYAPLFQGESNFVIVAAGIACTVEITTACNTQGGNVTGVPWQVTLVPGEIYQVSANTAGGNDLSGSRVRAVNGTDKFAVYSGHLFCAIGATNYKDWLYEVEYPINTWGKEYIAIPTIGQDYNLYRVMARDNGTTISVDGVPVGVFSAGQFYEDTLFSAKYITGSKAIIVSQFMVSGLASVSGDGDPALGLLNSNRQMLLDSVIFMADTIAYRPVDDPLQNFVSVVTRTTDTSVMYLNGAPLTNWQVLPQNPFYSYLSKEVYHGANYLTTTGCGFLAYSYSVCYAGSHFYSAGTNLDILNDSIILSNLTTGLNTYCVDDSVNFQASATGNVLSYVWDFGDATTSTLPSPTHAYSAANTYPVSVILTYNCYSDTLLDTVEVTQCCINDSLGFSYIFPDPCDSGVVLFTAISTGQIDSVEWYVGFPAGIGFTINHLVNFPNTGIYNINLWVESPCGWKDTTITITIPNGPDDHYVLNNTHINYCFGDPIASLSVTDTSAGTTGGPVNWYTDYLLTNNVGFGTTFSPLTPIGIYTYYVTETLACGEQIIDSINIEVINCLTCPNNFVTNPGFETITACPLAVVGNDDISFAIPWQNPPANPAQSSADLLNTCTLGNLSNTPHTGSSNGLIALFYETCEYREYLQAPLNQVLVAGKCYQASMYMQVQYTSRALIDSVGMYFSIGAPLQGNPNCALPANGVPGQGLISANPQVKNDASVDMTAYSWQLVTGTFIATGGEDYLTIGNFAPDVNLNPVYISPFPDKSAVYIFDDICLYEIPSDTINQDLIADTVDCMNINFTGSGAYNEFAWYNGGSVLVSNSQNYNATITDTYILYSSDSTICPRTYYRDTIVVTISSAIPNTLVNVSVCANDSILLGGIYQNTAGTYYDTLTSALGCDSIIETTLFIKPIPISTTILDECDGFNITVNGNLYDSTGTYIDTLVGANFNGCDSIVTTDLTIMLPSTSTQNLTECDGYSITINGNTYSTTGNYIDTITNGASNGCDSILTTNLTINQLPNLGTNNAISLCTADPSTDLFPLLGGADTGGSWSPTLSSGTGVFNPGIDPAGNYNYVINNAPCPADSSTVTVTINLSPTLGITTNDDNCASEEGSITLSTLTGIPPILFSWNTGQADSILTNLAMGTYTVIVSDSTGCTSTYITTINDLEIDCDYHIYLPNVFSPNGDGENDVLYVRGKGIEMMTLTIYNRWGNKVFETNDMQTGWDGTYHGNDQGSAVFVYFINATFINGQSIEEKGNVSIVK